jgi:hypothetical protein
VQSCASAVVKGGWLHARHCVAHVIGAEASIARLQLSDAAARLPALPVDAAAHLQGAAMRSAAQDSALEGSHALLNALLHGRGVETNTDEAHPVCGAAVAWICLTRGRQAAAHAALQQSSIGEVFLFEGLQQCDAELQRALLHAALQFSWVSMADTSQPACAEHLAALVTQVRVLRLECSQCNWS